MIITDTQRHLKASAIQNSTIVIPFGKIKYIYIFLKAKTMEVEYISD